MRNSRFAYLAAAETVMLLINKFDQWLDGSGKVRYLFFVWREEEAEKN